MNASWVVVAANSWGWAELHTGVVHMVVVGIAVGAIAPILAVTHTMEAVAAVLVVVGTARPTVVVAVHRMMPVVGSGHCSYEIAPSYSSYPLAE